MSLEKKVKINISKETSAFEKIKLLIANKPVLALPYLDKPFEIKTNTFNYAIGGVLFQRDENNNERPRALVVESLLEKICSTTKREMLAVFYWVRYWRAYMYGESLYRPFPLERSQNHKGC